MTIKDKGILSKIWIIGLYAAFHLNMMACSIYTDSRIGWVYSSYRMKELVMVAGFLCFSLSRRVIKGNTPRRVLIFGSNLIYSLSLLIVMLANDQPLVSTFSLLAMFTLGYMGGEVYYYVALGIAGYDKGGLVVAIATIIAYLAHYLLWILLGVDAVMVLVMVAGFAMVTYIVIKPQKDWIYMDPLPYSDKTDENETKRGRRSLFILIFLTFIAFLCTERANEGFINNYSGMADTLFGISRLSSIPVALLAGFLYDKKKHSVLSIIMLLSVMIKVWLPPEFYSEVLFVVIYNITEVYIILFITLYFWEAAPETDKPELWSSFGRVLMVAEVIMEAFNVMIPKDNAFAYYIFNVVLTFFAIVLVIMEITNRQEKYLEERLKEAYLKDDGEQHIYKLADLYNLTPRETDVVRELINNPEISAQLQAEHLNISRTMFYRYINQLYEKTGTQERTELINKLSDGYRM